MDFSDESYVRLYVRDTKTWLRLGFEGQCCLMFLLRKLDKAGVIDGMDDPHSDVALVTGVPEAIVAVGIPRLLKWGVFQLIGNRMVMPNYLRAQNAVRNDKARQRDLREKRLAQARLVTPRDSDVTPRDEPSRQPTEDNGASRDVTLCFSSLHSTELQRETARARGATPVPDTQMEPELTSSPANTEIRLLSPSKRDSEPVLTQPALHTRIPEQWKVSDEFYGEAITAGVTRAGLDESVRYWRGRKLGGEWFTIEDFFRGKFASIRTSEERARFVAHQGRAGPGGMAAKQHNPGITGFESFKEDP